MALKRTGQLNLADALVPSLSLIRCRGLVKDTTHLVLAAFDFTLIRWTSLTS